MTFLSLSLVSKPCFSNRSRHKTLGYCKLGATVTWTALRDRSNPIMDRVFVFTGWDKIILPLKGQSKQLTELRVTRWINVGVIFFWTGIPLPMFWRLVHNSKIGKVILDLHFLLIRLLNRMLTQHWDFESEIEYWISHWAMKAHRFCPKFRNFLHKITMIMLYYLNDRDIAISIIHFKCTYSHENITITLHPSFITLSFYTRWV